MRTVLLLVCFSSVVRADGPNDENSVAGMVMVKAMVEKQVVELKKKDEAIAALTDALKAKTEHTHVQLTTGGELFGLVSAADVKALVERMGDYEMKNAEIGTAVSTMREELKNGQLARELDATKFKLAAQEARVSGLSAIVAQLLGTSRARPMPVDAAETTAARRLQAGSSMWDAVGAGWRLVRRVAAGNTWHPATDRLSGTDVYGTMPSDSPQTANATFSISFSGESFTHFLFATGDEQVWLMCTKEAVGARPGFSAEYYRSSDSIGLRPILMSSDSPTPYSARWYNRNGVNEDPWISVTDHHGSAIPGGKLVYGADSFGGDHATTILPHHNGANVWIY